MASRDNPDFLSAKTIEGDKVVNSAGDDLGKIEDLMIDLHNGRVGYAVLSFGGLAGMGDKLFAIPWQALSLRLHEHAFTLDIPRDVLEKAEGLDKDNWPVTREELSRTYTYYGYQPYWQTGVTGQTTPAGTSREARGMVESQGPAGPGSRENPDFLSADSIKSDKLVNRAGDNIGKIEELMIDLQDGRVAYAVIAHGGFLGIGNKLFAIPWQSFSLRVHEHAFVLDIPKETLDKAKGIDKDNWPLTRDELSSTFSYYGYQPYWQTGAAAAAGISTGMAGETESERMARMERERQAAMPTETKAERTARMERERLEPTGATAAGVSTGMAGETEAERMARMERERQAAMPGETEAERMARAEREAHMELPGKLKSERMARMERERETAMPAGTVPEMGREEAEAERMSREDRERLEALRRTEEEKVSQFERVRMEKEKQVEALRQKLAQLERERMEAERQAEAERQRLAQLERELQHARRQEETEKVARLEREMREVQTREEAQRARLTQLERDRTEVERQAEVERQRLAQLERELTDKEKQAETEKEKLARLERERTEVERLTETERQTLAQMERERAEAESREKVEPERMGRMGGMEGRAGPEFLPESTIRGYRVVDTNGDDLGRIEDLIVDLDNGRIAYAALSLGGFLGMSDKLFAVPWQSLSPMPNEQAFTLDVPRDVLEKAEGFDKDKYPTTREELSRTYTYYGYQPYWQTGMERETGMPRGTESERMTRTERERQGRLLTAEEVMAAQEVETIENLEKKETDKEKLARLEREKVIAEKREHKYGK